MDSNKRTKPLLLNWTMSKISQVWSKKKCYKIWTMTKYRIFWPKFKKLQNLNNDQTLFPQDFVIDILLQWWNVSMLILNRVNTLSQVFSKNWFSHVTIIFKLHRQCLSFFFGHIYRVNFARALLTWAWHRKTYQKNYLL